jgi:sarcosine oxidase gamma subunit
VSDLGFLSPDRAAGEAVWRSPLERGLADAPAGIEDLSRTGVLDVRGDPDAVTEGEVVRLTPTRSLVLCAPEDVAVVRARLRTDGAQPVDLSAGYAGLRIENEAVLRRISDLDLADLPAVGSVAHVQTVVLRDGDDSFRLFFPQEYSDYMAEVVLDAAAGLTP